eukprot:g4427.t1
MGESDGASSSSPPTAQPTLLASAVSGVIARFPCHPLDTAKARLQVRVGGAGTGAKASLLNTLQRTVANEGLKGLYRGFGITVVGSAPATCLYLTSYENVKDRITATSPFFQRSDFLAHFMAGMVAEAFSCVLWVPIDVTKERLQVQERAGSVANNGGGAKALGSTNYRGSMDAITKIIRAEGLSGIYRGYGATIASFGPYSAFYFMFYEQIKRISLGLYSESMDESEGTGRNGSVGRGLSVQGGVEKAAAPGSGGSGSAIMPWGEYSGMFDGLMKIVRQDGIPGLFRGATARMAFHGPAMAITIASFETLKLKLAY